MTNTYLLENKTAFSLYESVKNLPIIDYHCHLSPQEIYEDKQFDNIGVIWLGGDHYKWRLMRTAGIDEKYITGDSSWYEKFVHYARALEFAAGNPLYHWSHMELSMFFGIDKPLTSETADEIWNEANEYIRKTKMSPRKLIKASGVEIICTTDDIIDSLEWHDKIKADDSFDVKVLPSYRTDKVLLMRRDDYLDYVKQLSAVSGIDVCDFASLKNAIENRLEFFVEKGCVFTDVGIVYFPDTVATDKECDKTFAKVLKGEDITDCEYTALVGNLFVFLSKIYKKHDLVQQLHLASQRNINGHLFETLGADCGVDCVGDTVSGKDLAFMLEEMRKEGLPETIVYTLNPANASQIASIAGSFPGVRCGAAWWFCDHKRGIREEMDIIAENSALGEFYGMLTDSRSFLSYARHDYFRRILCTMIGEWVEKDEFYEGSAVKLCKKVSYENVKQAFAKRIK